MNGMNAVKKILKPANKEKPTPLQAVVKEEIKQRPVLTDADIKARMERIEEDFKLAFEFLKKHPNTVSFFGSSVISPESKYYEQARALAQKIVEELNLSIVSGGGPGIMEAANRGAKEAKGDSVGMAIELPHEQVKNKYATHSADFYYFFSRKVALTFTARAYIYFPGGYGTLDELFEILTLKETGKIRPLPIILVGADYWKPLVDFIQNKLCRELRVISEADSRLFIQEDNPSEITKIIAGSQ